MIIFQLNYNMQGRKLYLNKNNKINILQLEYMFYSISSNFNQEKKYYVEENIIYSKQFALIIAYMYLVQKCGTD